MSKNIIDNVFNEVIDFNNLYISYKQVKSGKNRLKTETIKFSKDETYNLRKLQFDLKEDKYRFGTYTKFKVYEPKERIIINS